VAVAARALGIVLVVLALTAADAPAPKAAPGPPPAPPTDLELVEKLIAARKDYQGTLEKLRQHYIQVGDRERAAWAEEELKSYHRLPKQAYRLELDVPPPTLQAAHNVPEANELFRRARAYKEKGGFGSEGADNKRRAEILLQQLLTSYPQCDKIDRAAYELGDIYEKDPFKQYRRAAAYFERAYQWNPNTQTDARLRAARIYDRQVAERQKAIELYKAVLTNETDTARMQEAEKRLAELSGPR
jgi:tetratricopeptide (TPR) repeat protein